MFREVPNCCGNSVLEERIRKHEYTKHKMRVIEARQHGDKNLLSTINPYASVSHSITINNAKAVQLDEERMSTIQKHNRILFGRIQEIEMKQKIKHLELKQKKPNHILLGSLDMRKRKMDEIQTQNLMLLERLQSISPTYDHQKWRLSRKKEEKTLSNICRYPHIFKGANDLTTIKGENAANMSYSQVRESRTEVTQGPQTVYLNQNYATRYSKYQLSQQPSVTRQMFQTSSVGKLRLSSTFINQDEQFSAQKSLKEKLSSCESNESATDLPKSISIEYLEKMNEDQAKQLRRRQFQQIKLPRIQGASQNGLQTRNSKLAQTYFDPKDRTQDSFLKIVDEKNGHQSSRIRLQNGDEEMIIKKYSKNEQVTNDNYNFEPKLEYTNSSNKPQEKEQAIFNYSTVEKDQNIPEPMYQNDARVLKLLIRKKCLEYVGPLTVEKNRKVLWKNLCMLGPHYIECVIEFSVTKTKFFIIAIDLFTNLYHVIQLWTQQAQKLLKACDQDLEKIMKMLDFRLGKLYIKHLDMLMNYETYMPHKSQQYSMQKLSLSKDQTEQININIQTKTKFSPKRQIQKLETSSQVASQGEFVLCRGDKEGKLKKYVENFEKLQRSSEFMKFIQQRNKKEREEVQRKIIIRLGQNKSRQENAISMNTEPKKQFMNDQSSSLIRKLSQSINYPRKASINNKQLRQADQGVDLMIDDDLVQVQMIGQNVSYLDVLPHLIIGGHEVPQNTLIKLENGQTQKPLFMKKESMESLELDLYKNLSETEEYKQQLIEELKKEETFQIHQADSNIFENDLKERPKNLI